MHASYINKTDERENQMWLIKSVYLIVKKTTLDVETVDFCILSHLYTWYTHL